MDDWKKIYESKLVSMEEAASKIESGDVIHSGDNLSMPYPLIDVLCENADKFGLKDVTLIGSTSMTPHKAITDGSLRGKINYVTIFMGGFELPNIKNGNIAVDSCHLGSVARANDEVFDANVLMTEMTAPDKDGYLYFGIGGTATGYEAWEHAKKRIILVNHEQPITAGQRHRIHVSDVDWICECDHPVLEFPIAQPTEVEKQIAAHIIPYIKDGSCLQLGFGTMGNAIGYELGDLKNLSVWSEMFVDSMVYLDEKGCITGPKVASIVLGTKKLYDYVASGKVELRPISEVNDPYNIGKNDNVISINGALMVDLTGQICAESIGYKQYSSTGGQLDFVKGAIRSKGGKSFIALSSTYKTKAGVESRIKLNLPEGSIVTTPRSEAMYVVTEYGVADLFLQPIETRIKRMIAIAHPDYRDELKEGAIKQGLIREWAFTFK